MILELGGGRGNRFVRNILNGSGSIHFDNRGGMGCRCCKSFESPYNLLYRVPYNTSQAWIHAYPSLPDLLDDGMDTQPHVGICS